MARIRTEEEKEAARQAAKQAKKDQWLREQEEKQPPAHGHGETVSFCQGI